MINTLSNEEQKTENEKWSKTEASEKSSTNNVKSVSKLVKKPRKQRFKITSTAVDATALGEAYLKGNISNTEWSLMTPAARKVCLRAAKRLKKNNK